MVHQLVFASLFSFHLQYEISILGHQVALCSIVELGWTRGKWSLLSKISQSVKASCCTPKMHRERGHPSPLKITQSSPALGLISKFSQIWLTALASFHKLHRASGVGRATQPGNCTKVTPGLAIYYMCFPVDQLPLGLRNISLHAWATFYQKRKNIKRIPIF